MSTVKIILNFTQPNADDAELDGFTRRLQDELRGMDEVEQAVPVRCDEAPPGSKAIGDSVLGVLQVVFNPKNVAGVLGYLGQRLVSKPVLELEIEANGKKLKLKTSADQDVRKILLAAQAFVKGE